MAKAIPNPEPPRNGGAFDARGPLSREPVKQAGANQSAGLEPWNPDELLPKRGEDTSLLRQLETGLHPQAGGLDAEAVQQLHHENEQLKSIVLELEQELEGARGKGEQDWAERQKEYESLLDEKTELIRNLHLKIQEMQQQQRPPTPKEDELIAMSEELERERCQLQQERRQLDEELRQLKEDSETMTQEMRQMEVQMARERADLSRQRSELQRLNEEIRHELARVEQNGLLNEKLSMLQQRHRDVLKGGRSPGPGGPAPARTQMAIDLDADNQQQPPAQPPAGGKGKDSGLFRNIFRKKD